jgi:predicted DNA-binding protein with PD1-like motif
VKAYDFIWRPVRRFIVVFERGDDVLAELEALCGREDIRSATLTGIGGFERAKVAFLNVQSKEYEPIDVREQVEVVSFLGNVTQYNGKPKIHAHCVLGHRDGHTTAGHVLEAIVRPTLELALEVFAEEIRRTDRPDVGIPLIDL